MGGQAAITPVFADNHSCQYQAAARSWSTPHWRFCGESVRTFWWQYFFVSLVHCKDYLPVIGQWDLMGATLANHRQQTTKVSEAIEKVVAEMVKCQFI